MTFVILPLVLILAVLLIINVPIYLAILTAAIYLQVFVNHVALSAVFVGLYESLTKPSMLAIPFFILTGALIESSTMGKRLIDIFISLLKNVRAGLPISCLLANAVFGAISGSAPAAAATFGKVINEPLEKAHGEKLSLGLITSSGALSTIIPPSIIMIIYGVATDTNVATLFQAGFIPGLVIVAIISVYLFVRYKRSNLAGGKTDFAEVGRSFIRGLPVIVLPVLILGGIYAGVFTPTEAGAIAAVYSFVIGVFVLKDIKWSETIPILMNASRITGQIFLLISASIVFAQAATMAQIPQLIVEGFSGLGPIMFLVILNVLLLIVGCFFEPGAAILILAPLLLPTARVLGIDTLHLGIVFAVNLSIGMFTPPFGLNIFVVQSILKKPMARISSSVMPYVALYVIGLLILTYIPELSLWLPRLLGQ
ncbi:TRAP transporter large permease [Pelotomaculum terephthalicicum JT]|uniref:TRAP transporter large permease n=1 Tax=Pelotomaculum TaxID=191373 RepID=UPI0009D035FB|nr:MULTISPECIES: TRAP transporter large permease [Pelotomaculum]MCG9968195.1 TRAP transporter large permease [Pelotomaculum terephthalicicum JT]OPX83910.1 MAG: Sialic acid TRAP transporter permease protein SiaT [Pelotomaculum sp. PtaB.Bin117]OPY58522.1 MAG: Sialic acid TRAP transporter permease protein SiaT [Pelotomaculum sp. PtaU1.Bin065]